jgi:hypothetical protein
MAAAQQDAKLKNFQITHWKGGTEDDPDTKKDEEKLDLKCSKDFIGGIIVGTYVFSGYGDDWGKVVHVDVDGARITPEEYFYPYCIPYNNKDVKAKNKFVTNDYRVKLRPLEKENWRQRSAFHCSSRDFLDGIRYSLTLVGGGIGGDMRVLPDDKDGKGYVCGIVMITIGGMELDYPKFFNNWVEKDG